jgi:hypothetical protein
MTNNKEDLLLTVEEIKASFEKLNKHHTSLSREVERVCNDMQVLLLMLIEHNKKEYSEELYTELMLPIFTILVTDGYLTGNQYYRMRRTIEALSEDIDLSFNE